eukprot:171477_1
MTACPENATFVLNIIMGSISCIFALCMVYYIILHIKIMYKSSKELRPHKLLFICGTIFNIICVSYVLHLVFISIVWAKTCNQKGQTIKKLGIVLYIADYYFLWIVLFQRTYYVFNDTAFQISKCTSITLISIFILMAIISSIIFSAVKLHYLNGSQLADLVAIMIILAVFVSLAISVLFTYKLYAVSKMVKNNDGKKEDVFGSLIIRNTILVFVSLSSGIINALSIIFIPPMDMDSAASYIVHFMFLLDVTTNFLCVTLAYNCFTKQYNLLFGWMDKRCTRCCLKQTKKEMQLVTQMTTTTAVHDDTVTQTQSGATITSTNSNVTNTTR